MITGASRAARDRIEIASPFKVPGLFLCEPGLGPVPTSAARFENAVADLIAAG